MKMLLEILLLAIAFWFVFGAGFWGLVFQVGLRFEPRLRPETPGTGGGLPRSGEAIAATLARKAERDPLPNRNAPLTWA